MEYISLTEFLSFGCIKTCRFRLDDIVYNSNGNGRISQEQDPERESRVEKHMKRIQNVLSKSNIKI